jgi:diaminopimelate decarboxylase
VADPAAAVDFGVLPLTAAVSATGRLSVGGCDVGELAARFGTPLFIYDEDTLRARCREYADAFDGRAAYAGKAFLCKAMARLVAEEGLHLDVSTAGELHVALAAGFPPERMVLHGNNKSRAEIEAAVDAGIGRIVADSTADVDYLLDLARAGRTVPDIWLRITPGVEAHTHEYIETGTEDSKFGFPLAEAVAAAKRTVDGGHLRLAGLHCHIGSQIFVIRSYARAAEVMAGLLAEVAAAVGGPLPELNLGGGLGVAYTATETAPSVGEYAATLRESLAAAVQRAGLAGIPKLYVEPGRSIVARAGLTVYQVGNIKTIPGVRTYVAVDGGMSDNLRTPLYGARYEAFDPARVSAPRPLVATVVGKHCESGDIVVRDANLPDPPGPLLCTPATGAYGYAMASNYNKVPRPAVVFVAGGDARLVIRRETLDDLLTLESD